MPMASATALHKLIWATWSWRILFQHFPGHQLPVSFGVFDDLQMSMYSIEETSQFDLSGRREMDISFPYRNTMHTQTEDSFLHSKRSHQLSASLRSHVVSRSETNSCRGDGVHRPTNLRARRDGFWPSEIKLNPPSGQVLGIPQEPSSTTAIQYTLYRGGCSIGAQRERIHRVDHGAFPNRQ